MTQSDFEDIRYILPYDMKHLAQEYRDADVEYKVFYKDGVAHGAVVEVNNIENTCIVSFSKNNTKFTNGQLRYMLNLAKQKACIFTFALESENVDKMYAQFERLGFSIEAKEDFYIAYIKKEND